MAPKTATNESISEEPIPDDEPVPGIAVATKAVEDVNLEIERLGENDVKLTARSPNLLVTLKLILPLDHAETVGRDLIEASGEVE